MIEHLVFSTVVLALAILAAQLLPLTARTRHALLLCGLGKFAIPTAAFAWIGIEAIEVVPMPARVFDGRSATVPLGEASPNWWLIAWAAVAALLLARWLLLRARTIGAALRSPAPPSPRELALLADARRILGMRTAVDLLRSPLCEAPAVLRVVRPVVILPMKGCDDLTDDELRALLLHELAHVARRDNLVSIFVALAAALLWFHPLVWLAVRRLDAAREQACDETAAEHADSYLDALAKVCRALVAPRTAGVACMAGANLRERMNHLMQFEGLKQRAWSHRGVVAAALLAVLAATGIAATPPAANQQYYSLQFDVIPAGDKTTFDVRIVETLSGTVVVKGMLTALPDQWGTITGEHKGRTVEVQARRRDGEPAQLLLVVTTPTEKLQRTLYTWDNLSTSVAAGASQFTGAPISINLKDAQLQDVMNVFAKITGLRIVVDPTLEAKININVTDMPWDQAMDLIAKQAGARIAIENKTIHVTK